MSRAARFALAGFLAIGDGIAVVSIMVLLGMAGLIVLSPANGFIYGAANIGISVVLWSLLCATLPSALLYRWWWQFRYARLLHKSPFRWGWLEAWREGFASYEAWESDCRRDDDVMISPVDALSEDRQYWSD
jgi:hypothetical protein